MKNFLKLLISKLNTIDGTRNTANNIKNNLYKEMVKDKRAFDVWSKAKIRQQVERQIVGITYRKYLILKIRQKISYEAFIQKKTVIELIARQVLYSFI